MKNWKTSLLGVLTILVPVGAAVLEWLKTGTAPNVAVLATAATAGWGLIQAKDATARL
jgi:hypothetical protein